MHPRASGGWSAQGDPLPLPARTRTPSARATDAKKRSRATMLESFLRKRPRKQPPVSVGAGRQARRAPPINDSRRREQPNVGTDLSPRQQQAEAGKYGARRQRVAGGTHSVAAIGGAQVWKHGAMGV